MVATDRLLDVLKERNEEIRRLKADNEVLTTSLRNLAAMHGEDEIADDIVGELQASGRGAQVRRVATAPTR